MGKKRTKSERRAATRHRIAMRRRAAGRGKGGLVLGPTEFATVFRLRGGLEHIGRDFPEQWQAFDARNERVTPAVVPHVLGIGRDKATKLMAKAREAERLREIRESRRERQKQRRTSMLLDAHARDAQTWCRDRDVIDQQLRYVMSGTNGGADPTVQSRGQLVCWRDGSRDGLAYTAYETWEGEWSNPDSDGIRERIGVSVSEPMEWPSSDTARRGTVTLLRLGEISEHEHFQNGAYLLRHRADKLLRWERTRNGAAGVDLVDMKAELEQHRPQPEDRGPVLPKGARWARKLPHL